MTQLEELQADVAEEEKPVKALFEHCLNVYKEMHTQARDEEGAMLYSGHLTKLFQALDLAVPYYTSVMKQLKAMGCVEQKRRGGGGAPSVWQLYREPEREAFEKAVPLRRPVAGKMAALEQQLRDVNTRLLRVEHLLGGDE